MRFGADRRLGVPGMASSGRKRADRPFHARHVRRDRRARVLGMSLAGPVAFGRRRRELPGGDGGAGRGVGLGCVFLKWGYTLGRSYPTPKIAGWIFPAVMALLLALLLLRTSFQEGQAIFFSGEGPGAMHAPLWLAWPSGC